MILINKKFNNQDVVVHMRTDLSENRVSLIFFFDNLIVFHQPPQKIIY
jgi:hypothetical protein